MKIGEAKSAVKARPFFKDHQLEISAIYTPENGIQEFTATYKKQTKVFKVNKNYDIEKAWKEMEKWLSKMK